MSCNSVAKKVMLLGLVVLNLALSSFAQTHWARVSLKSEWFYIDSTGKKTLSCTYTQCSNFSEGLALVKGDKLGYIDPKGKIVVPLKLGNANPFQEGKAFADFGFIDKTGQPLFKKHRFKKASNFSEGFAAATDKGNWGYINSKGEYEIAQKYQQAFPFSEGLALVQKDNAWSYLNVKGKVSFVIKENVIQATSFKEGFATIKTSKGWGTIDPDGIIVLEPTYANLENIGSGYLKQKIDAQNENIIRGDGKVVKSAGSFKEFSEGLVAVKTNGLWGYWDSELNEIIKPNYEEVGKFVNGLAPVKKDGLWGYINKKGAFVIPASFHVAEAFHRID